MGSFGKRLWFTRYLVIVPSLYPGVIILSADIGYVRISSRLLFRGLLQMILVCTFSVSKG